MSQSASRSSSDSASSSDGPDIDLDTIREDLEEYHVVKELGEGGYGRIVEVRRKDGDEETLAVKALPLSALKKLDISKKAFLARLATIEKLDHPGLTPAHFHRVTSRALYIFMPVVSQKTLVERLNELPDCRLPEAEAKKLTKRLCEVLSYIHAQCVIHRDIKGENVWFESTSSPIAEAMVGDLDAITIGKKPGQKHQSNGIGTPGYSAPEIVKLGKIDERVDEWALGSLIAEALTGRPILAGEDTEDINHELLEEGPNFDSSAWRELSSDALDFVKRLLEYKPKDRMTVDEALRHPWLTGKRPVDDSASSNGESEEPRRKSRRLSGRD